LDALRNETASLETRAVSLATISGSLITTASLHEQRLGNIQSYTASLKTAIELTGSSVTILGNLNVRGTQTVLDSTTVQIGDNIIELNGTSATNAGIIVKDPTGASLITGSLIYDTTTDYWIAGKQGNESKILLAGGDNVFTSSLQLGFINFTTASLNQTTSSLNEFSASVTSSLVSIYQTTASLNSYTASVNGDLASIHQTTASLNLFSASVTSSLVSIYQTTAFVK